LPATTVNVYAVPLDRPATVAVVTLELAVFPPGELVTT
jgi:hypothetical protein